MQIRFDGNDDGHDIPFPDEIARRGRLAVDGTAAAVLDAAS